MRHCFVPGRRGIDGIGSGSFAVFDVRERGEYNECQIPCTTSLPRSQIEFRIESAWCPIARIPIIRL